MSSSDIALIVGIDPGVSGGFATLSWGGTTANATAFDKVTPRDIATILRGAPIKKAYIEQVHSMPLQGVRSVFTFGENYGLWQGILTALGIPFERVPPLTWQTAMRCRTGGDKNISKTRAQELFPNLKITHAIADSLLIAEYGRRREVTQSGQTEKRIVDEEVF